MTEELQALRLRYGVPPGPRWLVGAEDYARRWTGGRSNLFSLAEANVATTLVCHQVFGSTPIAVHPHTARAQVGVPTAAAAAAAASSGVAAIASLAETHGCGGGGDTTTKARTMQARATTNPANVKERVLAFVTQHAPDGFDWPLQDACTAGTRTRRRRRTTGDLSGPGLHPCCYDVADAYIIARYVVLHAEDCSLLEANADLLVERQAAFRASKRYASSYSRAQTEKGKAAARKYDAGVSKRIERKLLADLRAGKMISCQ